jgi:hypothetical protein
MQFSGAIAYNSSKSCDSGENTNNLTTTCPAAIVPLQLAIFSLAGCASVYDMFSSLFNGCKI